MDAIVLDADLRTAVGGIRALGRSGLRVGVAGRGRWSAGCRSRFAAEAARLPSAEPALKPFADGLIALAARWGSAPIYAGSDVTLDALTAVFATANAGLVMPYPNVGAVRTLRDKRSLPQLAREAGLRHVEPLFEGRLGDVDPEALPFPCALKSAVASLDRTYVADSAAELRADLAGLDPDIEVIVQPRLRGPLVAMAIVLDRDGRVVARFQQRARRTWPAGGGSSSVAVGVEPQDDLVEQAARLLRSAGYWGLAQLQFMETADGLRLIDVNPRFYGSMPLAVASGVNLPAIWHAVTVGSSPGPAPSYRAGVVFRWLEADLIGALRGSPSRLRVGISGPRVGAMWSGDDPLPGIVLAANAVSRRFANVARRRSQAS